MSRGTLCLMAGCLIAACSALPGFSNGANTGQNMANTQLEMGNKQADRGDYESALLILNEARRLAVLADDSSLRIRTGLSRGNVLFALGRAEEALAEWAAALDEAEKRLPGEMAAVCRIHQARGRLLAALAGAGDASATARAVRDEVRREMALVKDRLYTAFAWLVIGLSEKELGAYKEAEAALKKSLEIHEKNGYPEQAAYDWYLIASFRSRSGNYDGALQALDSALVRDRQAENSSGIAADWRARGDVYKRAGRNAEAREAYLRAAEIFRSLGNDREARAVEQRAE
jgi:tetratricopeptide (TPR) repeat protein